MRHGTAALATLFAAVGTVAARADVVISTAATHHMKCSEGLCVPTGNKAVLNATYLVSLLKSGNVKIATSGSGVQADDIRVATRLKWSSVYTLALDAYRSLEILNPISIEGVSGISLVTNDGGSDGLLRLEKGGRIAIKNLSTMLSVNGTKYALANTVSGLATEIANDPQVAVALANSYDASVDGIYSTSPIPTLFQGRFEGLGNTISNLSINDSTDSSVALFAGTQTNAVISDIKLANVAVTASATNATAAALVAQLDEAFVSGSSASGTVSGAGEGAGLVGENNMGNVAYSSASVSVTGGSGAGGLVGGNIGEIAYCFATGSIGTTSSGTGSQSGGLVAQNGGSITQSFATGAVSGAGWVGGLAGYNVGGVDYRGDIENSYATGSVTAASGANGAGGLIGENDDESGASSAYSTGYVTGGRYLGGFAGIDESSGYLSDAYWDIDTSGITNLSQGAGSPPNDPGITGLTTQQFQSGLPNGFDPKIWAENPNINNGLPYLIANPPPK